MELETQEKLQLPDPQLIGALSLEAALHARRSVRAFTGQNLTLAEVAQLLWAAQGITESGFGGLRTAPSAGALYPLEVFLLTGDVVGLAPGLYRYRPHEHALSHLADGDRRAALAEAALGQDWIADAASVLLLAAVYARTTGKYGARGERYVHIEVGHAGQNIYLQAYALGLGTTMVGAFRDREVQRIIGLETNEVPLALMPLGRLR